MCPDHIFLVDLDSTVFKHGTYEPLPGAHEALLALQKRGTIWFFSCRPPTMWEQVEAAKALPGVMFAGILPKPYASKSYSFIDDKLDISQCDISLQGAVEGEWTL